MYTFIESGLCSVQFDVEFLLLRSLASQRRFPGAQGLCHVLINKYVLTIKYKLPNFFGALQGQSNVVDEFAEWRRTTTSTSRLCPGKWF